MHERIKPCKSASSFFNPQTLTAPSSRMARRSFLRPSIAAFAAASSLLAIFALSHSFLSPSIPPSISSSFSSSSSAHRPKIYLYDLPRLFTYSVVESYRLARNPLPSPLMSDSEIRYPGHQHSAEWWLFTDLLRIDRFSSPVERVSDPEEADLFFVPFFSSLSVIVNPIRSGGSDGVAAMAYSDEEMQEELVRWVEGQEYWGRNGGRDHVFVCQDPNALYKVVDRVKNGVLLVSDFGRLRGDQGSLVKDVILPYSHRINRFEGEVGVEGRNSLMFFMGNRFRKEVSFS